MPVCGVFCRLSACCDGFCVRWEVWGCRFGLSGRAKADSKGLLSVLRVRAVCLAGRRPWGEAVGEDVSAGRLVTLGPGRRGGFFGLGSFDREGLFEVVSDG